MLRPGNLKRLLAGAIFGLYMAHLLYYLNPQIDITPLRLLLVTLVYSVICALIFGGALVLLRFARVRLFGRASEPRPHGFGFVVFASFFSALVYWAHLFVFRIYLPPGAIRLLSKATNIVAATAFVLFLIWLFERTAAPRIARALLITATILIAISAFFLYQRRERYAPDVREAQAVSVSVAATRPVVVIAVTNLPYDWIITVIGEGGMPALAETIEQSYFTRIEPFRTTSPKALSASLATGKLPFRHGVTGRFSYETPLNPPGERYLILPAGVGFRGWGLIPPVRRISAQLPSGESLAFWSIFERIGYPSSVINWTAARPGSTRAGEIVTQESLAREQEAVISGRDATAIPPLVRRRIASIPRRIADPLLASLAADAVAARRAAEALPRERGVVVVALNGFSSTLRSMRANTNVLRERNSNEGLATRLYLGEIDRMIAAIRAAAGDAVVFVVSPSAPEPPPFPASPAAFGEVLALSEDPGRSDGFLLIAGRGIVTRDNPRPAHVADVVPTILYAAGLPVGRDIDGQVITGAFAEAFLRSAPLSMIQTWEAERVLVNEAP
jgi:hypothetical protein